ncbi:YhcH/YjgK/YiaL family protein [Vibrio sp. F74]|uniref:YhcH/YjgK/YiaL family protein n=1 Tax=Vibrio sp. F74 TaxID=700020 RepID=UPI0035F5F514
MHIGNLDNLALSSQLHPIVKDILNTVADMIQRNELPDGKHYLQEDIFLFTAEVDTETLEMRRSEIHNDFMDIQILLDGEERFGYSYKGYETVTENQLDNNDIAFVDDVIDEKYVNLTSGDFIIFYPNQPHRPMICVDTPKAIKKMVVKINKKVLL